MLTVSTSSRECGIFMYIFIDLRLGAGVYEMNTIVRMTTVIPHKPTNSILYLLILLYTPLYLASSAVINLPSSTLTTNSAANGNQCTENATWIGTGATSADCILAVAKLYNAEVKQFSDTDFEFLTERAPSRSIPWMRTPRKYTVGEWHQTSNGPSVHQFIR